MNDIYKGVKWYLTSLLNLHKRLYFVSLKRICEKVPPSFACQLMNCHQWLTGRQVSFHYKSDLELYTASDSLISVFFSERMRGFWLYSPGIEERGLSIIQSYFIDIIDFQPNDIVIDCGANYGDLFIGLRKIQPRIKYISFEPSPKEHECLKYNVQGQEHHRLALYKKSCNIDFYLSSEGADSSTIEPHDGYTEKITINAISLDGFARDIPKIKLLKLEAEGVEPEILEGAKETLGKIEYIAADGGAERGPEKETTLECITNTLLTAGFKLIRVDIKSGKGRALYRNKAM